MTERADLAGAFVFRPVGAARRGEHSAQLVDAIQVRGSRASDECDSVMEGTTVTLRVDVGLEEAVEQYECDAAGLAQPAGSCSPTGGTKRAYALGAILLSLADPTEVIATLPTPLLGPLAWRTPPRAYGPWEQVVSLLAERLVARGVDVTLFASLDSLTRSTLDGVCATTGSTCPSGLSSRRPVTTW